MRRVRILLTILFTFLSHGPFSRGFPWPASEFAPFSCHIWIMLTHNFLTLFTDLPKMGAAMFSEYSQTTELSSFSYCQSLYSRFLIKRKIPRHCRGKFYKDKIRLSKTRNCDVVLLMHQPLRLFRNTSRLTNFWYISRPRLRYLYNRG